MTNIAIYLYSFLTLAVFVVSLKLHKKLNSSIFNPFILSLIILAIVLVNFEIPFSTYYQGNFPINQLLGVSVVALAVPFYEQLPQLRKHWRKITLIVLIATLLTMIMGALLAVLLGANAEMLASFMPKSVTIAMAIAISDEIGGSPAITAIAVLVAGTTGAAFGLAVLQFFRIDNSKAIGLSIGAVSHALGTARIMGYSVKAGSYSSVALVLCGIFSSLLAPIVFHAILDFFLH